MKNYLLLIIAILFTSVGYGKDLTGQTSILAFQPAIENNKTTASHFFEREYQERSYIDTADDKQTTTSKPEKKRHLFAKTVLVLVGAFVVIVILAFRNGY